MNGLRVLLTLTIGFTGALIAFAMGLPAAALIGSSLAVSAAAYCKLVRPVPSIVQSTAFTIIGLSLGSSVTRDLVAEAAHWPISLFILTLAIIAIMVCCGLVLTRFFNQSSETAILATSPGALGFALAIAAEGVGDVRAIIAIQSVRLLLVTTLLPFALDLLSGHPGSVPAGADAQLSMTEFLVIFAFSIVLGAALARLRLPAAYLLAGMFVSSLAHYFGGAVGRPAPEILFAGFSLTGTLIGARFTSIDRDCFRKLIGASIASFFVSVILAAAFSFLTGRLLSISFGQVFVAFAPGGVEAMAAMALSLNYDPAFVAVHHLYRIILLIFILPVFLKLAAKMRKTRVD